MANVSLSNSLKLMVLVAALAMLSVLSASANAESLASAQYVVVVGHSAPATDVIVAADFSASMKASTGATFKSALDTEAYDAFNGKSLAYQLVVVIDGTAKQVRVIGGLQGPERDVIEQYFSKKGYSVKFFSTAINGELLNVTGKAMTGEPVRSVEPKKDSADEVPKNSTIQKNSTVQPVVNSSPAKPVVAPSPEKKNSTVVTPVSPDDAEPLRPVVQENPGFFARVWGWMKDLF